MKALATEPVQYLFVPRVIAVVWVRMTCTITSTASVLIAACAPAMRMSVDKALQYAYRDRKAKKRDFRALWIIRINAATRALGLTYSQFMAGLKKAEIVEAIANNGAGGGGATTSASQVTREDSPAGERRREQAPPLGSEERTGTDNAVRDEGAATMTYVDVIESRKPVRFAVSVVTTSTPFR